jgi:outer membrane protein assembly factor BamB
MKQQSRASACIAAVVLGMSGVMNMATAAENWPMFGKNYENTRSTTDTQISVSNVESLGVARRTADGGVTGTPTVVDGVAYYSDFSGYVKAVRVSDGVVLWRVRPQTTMLSPSPFVTADSVYVAGNNSWVYALNRIDGALRWSTRIETSPNSRISSSPIVFDNILMIGTGSYQVFIPATPMFRGRVVFMNATTGAILPYSTDMCPAAICGGGISVWSTAAVDESTRTGYIGTGQAYRDPAGPYSDALVAFDVDTGAIRWSHQFQANDVYQLGGVLRWDVDVGAAPNLFVANERRMVGVGGKDGTYRAFDRDTGELIWNTPVGRGSPIGGVMQSTAYGDGRIYVTSNTSTIGGGRNDPVPATAEALALDAATGTPVWIRQLDAGGFGGIAYANGLMYTSAWDGRLRVFNAANGNIIKEVQASPSRGVYVPAPTDGFPNGSAGGPIVYGDRVLMGYGWTWVLNINGGLATMELLSGSGGESQTVTLSADQDTYVQSGTPTTNYNSNEFLLARLADAEGLTRASFLQFQLGAIPEGTVTSARLRLYGRHDAPTGSGQPVSVWPGTFTTPWNGLNVIYNNSDLITGVNFYLTSPIANALIGITPQYYEWDVTGYVDSRRSLGHATFGVAVDYGHVYRVTFNSSDNVANRPELVVTVTTGSGEPEPDPELPPGSMEGSCPAGFTPRAGVNQGFIHNGVARGFVLNVPTNVSTPRPMFVSLTGSVESTNENLGPRGGAGALTNDGFLVIGPVRRCAGQDPNGGGTNVNGGTCNQGGTGGWNWNPWNEGRAFGAAGEQWKTNAGPDSEFLEAVARCVAKRFPVDASRMYLGGISSGGTLVNRALMFNSDFWAGGLPISGEWYVTQDNGNAYPGADEFAARRQAVIDNPTKIFQGRVGPFPLPTSLDPMIVITVWGGTNDIWFCGSTLCADYRPSTQAGSNYFSADPNVVHVACSSTHGHQWPTVNRAAFNTWAATTLASHPKGTPASAFVLPPPPPGYSCRIGPYIDHYERACSIDADGDIDRDDIALITAARNQPASGPTDLRDVDRNGVIDVNDARACTLRCDRPNCAVQ